MTVAGIVPQPSPAGPPNEPAVSLSADGGQYVHVIFLFGRFYPARIVHRKLSPTEQDANRRTFAQLCAEVAR